MAVQPKRHLITVTVAKQGTNPQRAVLSVLWLLDGAVVSLDSDFFAGGVEGLLDCLDSDEEVLHKTGLKQCKMRDGLDGMPIMRTPYMFIWLPGIYTQEVLFIIRSLAELYKEEPKAYTFTLEA